MKRYAIDWQYQNDFPSPEGRYYLVSEVSAALAEMEKRHEAEVREAFEGGVDWGDTEVCYSQEDYPGLYLAWQKSREGK